MRPINVVVLLLAGALGGALIMKVAHPRKPAVLAARMSQVQPPATAPPERPEPPAPAMEAAPAEPETAQILVGEPAQRAKPSPMPLPERAAAHRETAKPQPIHPVALTVALSVPGLVPVPAAPAEAPPPVEDPAPAPVPPPDPAPAPPPVSPAVSAAPAPQPHQVTLNAGLLLPVRLVDGLSSERNTPGDAFAATLDRELVADGFVIAERGARVEGRVVAIDRAKMRAAALAVELTRLHTSDGQSVAIQTDDYFKHADPGEVSSTTKIAGGAIIGAAIGAMAGGGKGAAIGAGIGGGAGAGDVLLTRGKPAELASETLVTFKLKTPVPLIEQLR